MFPYNYHPRPKPMYLATTDGSAENNARACHATHRPEHFIEEARGTEEPGSQFYHSQPGNCFFDSVTTCILSGTMNQIHYFLNQLRSCLKLPQLKARGKLSDFDFEQLTNLPLPPKQKVAFIGYMLRLLVASSLYLYHTDDSIKSAFTTWAEMESAARESGEAEFWQNYMHVSGLYDPETKKPLDLDQVVQRMLKPSTYWGDEYAITCLERFLHLRVIVCTSSNQPIPALDRTPFPHLIIFLKHHAQHYTPLPVPGGNPAKMVASLMDYVKLQK